MIKLLIILQLYVLDVAGMKWGDYYYARISPEKAFGSEEILSGNNVLLIKCDSSLVGTQHFQYYGCRIPYFRLNCDIIVDNKAYYMERVDYLNDKESLKNLTE
jgi:hypothetical protein